MLATWIVKLKDIAGRLLHAYPALPTVAALRECLERMLSDSPSTGGYVRLLPNLLQRSRDAADPRVQGRPHNSAWLTSVQNKVCALSALPVR